jgi:hypothetical protein
MESTSKNKKFINLFVYCDSLAFRRKTQSQDLEFTYPFKLKELIETHLGIRANLILRGGGGLTIKQIRKILTTDSGFFDGEEKATNITILQFGIVDCAPRPFTYLLAPLLKKMPSIFEKLVTHRRKLQIICSYTATSKRIFKKVYASIVKTCHASKCRPLAIGLPLPPISLELRSPGFRRNVSIYNNLIREVLPESFCDIEKNMNESLREVLLLSDGHHLTEAGHMFYAEQLFEYLKKLL